MLTIASWNINSIHARLDRVVDFLHQTNVDILCLQELKCETIRFPKEPFMSMGFLHQAVSGQKAYNGVAIIAKQPFVSQETLLFSEKPEARVITAYFPSVVVVNIYAINGQSLDSPECARKLHWFLNLKNYLSDLKKRHKHIVVVGDFNITPTDQDSWAPVEKKDTIFHSSQERKALADILQLGFLDSFRTMHTHVAFSWWDYRQFSFFKNHGLRIDLGLITENLATHCIQSDIAKHYRDPKALEGKEASKPSDHTPILLTFKDL